MAKKKIQKKEKAIPDTSYLNYILYVLIALFIYVFIVNAWVGDDAYITFRTVDNFVNGYGLTWNTSERVQAYTHPLWMFIHSFFYSITGNIYYTTMFLSFVFSFAAVCLLVFKIANNKLLAIAGLATLIISKTFIDYTSSGLENPLTYFLIALFLIFYLNKDEAQKKIFKLSLITALVMLNRMDLVLLLFPALIYIIAKNWNVKHLFSVFYGFIPFIIWEIFSIIYYGFPFPNTYYAKLNTGIPIGEYISQGFQYYYALFNFDPLTLIIIFLGLSFSIFIIIKRKDNNKEFLIFLGVFLYLLYIIRIGGDFMCGRYFAAPLFLIVVILTHINYKDFKINNKIISSFVIILIIFMFAFTKEPAILTSINFGTELLQFKHNNKQIWERLFKATGIADEKKFYYSKTGLLPMIYNGESTPKIVEIKQAIESKESEFRTFIRGFIGYFGYYAGPKIHIIDNLALTDPLLARLNYSKDPNWTYSKWRIGHFMRRIPLGYLETINAGKNHLENNQLKEYYEKLKTVTQSGLFSQARFAEIWRINTGYYDDLLVNNYKANYEPQIYSGDDESIKIYNLRMGNYFFSKYQDRFALNYYHQLLANEKWIKLGGIRSNIYERAAELYIKFHKPDSAIYFAEKGFKYAINKDMAMHFANYIYKYYKRRNNPDKALSTLDRFLEYFPNEIPILKNKADFYVSFGQSDKAVNVWKKMIELNPNIHNCYYNLFAYYFNKKLYDSASYYAFKSQEKGEYIESHFLEFLKKYKH